MDELFTVQIHRDHGPDEDFEFEYEDEATNAAYEAVRHQGARRAVVIDEAGRVVDEVLA